MNIGKAESRRIYLVDSINDDCDHPPARLRRVQGGSGRVRCPAHPHLHPHHRHHHPPLPPLEHQGGPGGAAASSA